MSKKLKQAIGEAFEIVTTAHALADAAVRAKVPYAEVAKLLRGAFKVSAKKLDGEQRAVAHERYLRSTYGNDVAEARLAAEREGGIDNLNLSVRASNVCQQLGIDNVKGLAEYTPSLLRAKGVGLKTIREMHAALHRIGRSLKLREPLDEQLLRQQNGAAS